MRKLFPTDLVGANESSAESAEDCLLFTVNDLEEAAFSLKDKKAPGCYLKDAVVKVVGAVHRGVILIIDLDE